MKLWKLLPSQQEPEERPHTYLFSASRFPIQPPLSRTWTKKLVHVVGCWNQSKHIAFCMSYGRYRRRNHPHAEVNRKPVGAMDMKMWEWRSAVVRVEKVAGKMSEEIWGWFSKLNISLIFLIPLSNSSCKVFSMNLIAESHCCFSLTDQSSSAVSWITR